MQQKLRPDYVGNLAEIFALRWLETEHNLTREKALHQVALGVSEELGAHGFVFDEPKRTLVVLVCNPSKYMTDFAESLGVFDDRGFSTLFAERDDTIEALFSPVGPSPKSRRFRTQFQSLLDECMPSMKVINLRLIYFGNPDSAAESAILSNFQEDIRKQRQLIDARFIGVDVEITTTVKSADGSSGIPDRLKGYRHNLPMTNRVEAEGPNGELMHFGIVPLWELLEMYRKLRIRFLSRNVRAALTVSTGSNRALSKAFLDVATGSSQPGPFLFRHNGVTLTASSCHLANDGLELSEPQLLNGAQTITTLFSVHESLVKTKTFTKAMEARLKRLVVIGRVISNASKEFVTSVTIASNRQNPIMPWHLRAHDDIQSLLQSWFLDHLGLYYETQEKAFQSMSEDDREASGMLDTEKCLEIKKLAQTFLATDGSIDKMQQLKAVFEDDELYGRTFHQGRIKAQPEDVVLCYKIDRRIRKMLNVLGGTEKYSFVKGARSLIWALLCQSYLNSSNRERLAVLHGRGLVVSDQFTQEIEKLAISRVKPLLMWIANDSEYAIDVKAERYGFLGSRKAFDSTMAVARDRWAWQHRRLGNGL